MESISIPGTPAGHQAGEWLDCLESGELDRLRDFAARHYSAAALDQLDAEVRAALDLGVVYRDTRGLVPEQVQWKWSSETELWLLVRARLTGELLRLHVAVEAQPPHPIIGIQVDFVPPGKAPYDAILSEAEIVTELGDFVDLLASADCFSGAVLFTRGEEVLLECAHGLARHEPAVRNQPDTRFNHASVQKMSQRLRSPSSPKRAGSTSPIRSAGTSPNIRAPSWRRSRSTSS